MAAHIIEEGFRNLVVRFYDDAGGQTDTIDVSALSPPCADLRIMRIIYNSPATGTSFILGDATADVKLWDLNGHSDTHCFEDFGGIVNNAGAGKTGDITVTRADASTSIIVWFKKVDTVAPFPN